MKSVILAKMQDEMKKAMKAEVNSKKEGTNSGMVFDALMAVKYVVRSVLSLFPDEDIKPENATDDDTIAMIKKVIFKEKTSELYNQRIFTEDVVVGLSPKELTSLTKEKIFEMGDSLTNLNIKIAESYLPKQATEEEIKQWISDNIDFSKLNNKMQAMKPTIEQFKGIDGLVVKNIINEMT
jgi:uncharacterized protein